MVRVGAAETGGGGGGGGANKMLPSLSCRIVNSSIK